MNKLAAILLGVVLAACGGESSTSNGPGAVSTQELCSVPGETDCTGEVESDDAGYIAYRFGGLPFGGGPVRVVSCTCTQGCPRLYTVLFIQHAADAFCRDAEAPTDATTADAGADATQPCQEPDIGRLATFFCPGQPVADE